MLTPKKKISKRELKEDALVSTYVKATTFYEENKRMISIGVTVFAVLVIALIVYGKNRTDNNVNATTALGNVYQLFDNGQYQLAVDGVPERNIKGLKAIVDDYGNSQAGEIARFYLGNAYYHLGKYDDAIEQFKACSLSDETLEISRISALACAYEAKGMHKDAAEYFEKAATRNSKDVNAAENLNNAARNYAQAGEKATALELYRKLKKTYPSTPVARDADRENRCPFSLTAGRLPAPFIIPCRRDQATSAPIYWWCLPAPADQVHDRRDQQERRARNRRPEPPARRHGHWRVSSCSTWRFPLAVSGRERAPVRRLGVLLIVTYGVLIAGLGLGFSSVGGFDHKNFSLLPLDYPTLFVASVSSVILGAFSVLAVRLLRDLVLFQRRKGTQRNFLLLAGAILATAASVLMLRPLEDSVADHHLLRAGDRLLRS